MFLALTWTMVKMIFFLCIIDFLCNQISNLFCVNIHIIEKLKFSTSKQKKAKQMGNCKDEPYYVAIFTYDTFKNIRTLYHV